MQDGEVDKSILIKLLGRSCYWKDNQVFHFKFGKYKRLTQRKITHCYSRYIFSKISCFLFWSEKLYHFSQIYKLLEKRLKKELDDCTNSIEDPTFLIPLPVCTIPAVAYLLKCSNENTRKICEIYSKLTMRHKNDVEKLLWCL